MGPLLGRAFAVGGELPEFGLSGLGGERDDAFAVGQEARFAVADAGVAGDFHDASGFGGEQEDGAAGGEDDVGAIGREVGGGEIVERLLDPVLAHLVEVGDEGDGDKLFVTGGEIEQPEVGAGGVDDAAFEERGGLHVEECAGGFPALTPWP